MVELAIPRAVDSAKVIQVIETTALRGAGTKGSPGRAVVQYWSFDGKLLAENDPSTVAYIDSGFHSQINYD